jgi:shikimate kinase
MQERSRNTGRASAGNDRSLNEPAAASGCISLIGMPGSGKTTLGRALAAALSWAFVDTDHLLESWYGLPLEALRNRLGKEGFLTAEEDALVSLDVARCIVATGGSVIYSPAAMKRLKNIGEIVYLQADLETITARVAQNPERGLVMAPGQTIEGLYRERIPIYERYADMTLRTDECSLESCLTRLKDWMHAKQTALCRD